jgi:GTP-binding protein HflX
LFATLTTRTREWKLSTSEGQQALSVMLSDTVGFVRDIPTHLVASFKATLEEATHADVLLIMLDVSDPAAEIQYNTVQRVLDELMEEVAKSQHEEDRTWEAPKRILLLNKVDKLRDNRELLVWQSRVPSAIPICALPQEGAKPPLGQRELTELIRAAAQGGVETLDVTVPLSDAKTINMIERQAEVISREYSMEAKPPTVTLRARIGKRQLAAIRSAGARIAAATTDGKQIKLPAHRRNPDEVPTWGQ